MADYNKAILIGRLTRDPQLSYMPSERPVCEIGMAVNRKFKGSDGQVREETLFVDCKAYGNTAETMAKHLTKGRPLMVEGRLTLDSWEKGGQRHNKHTVTVEKFQFLGGKEEKPKADQFDTPGGDDLPF